MLLAYVCYIIFQLKTHRQLFESEEVITELESAPQVFSIMGSFHNFKKKTLSYKMKNHLCWWNIYEQGDDEEEKAVIGFWVAFTWLVGMTLLISLLSEYVVGTIEV